MPTYDFRCPSGHVFEVFQKMSDDPNLPCPECGETAERLVGGGTGFLKGGGQKGEPPHAPRDVSERGR